MLQDLALLLVDAEKALNAIRSRPSVVVTDEMLRAIEDRVIRIAAGVQELRNAAS